VRVLTEALVRSATPSPDLVIMRNYSSENEVYSNIIIVIYKYVFKAFLGFTAQKEIWK